ncbi:MAG: DUF3179 domain-containing protein [Gaiellales bacterium]
MRRFLLICLGVGLFTAACGGAADTSPDAESDAQPEAGAAEPAAAPASSPDDPQEPADPSELTSSPEAGEPAADPAPGGPTESGREILITDADEAKAILQARGVFTDEWNTDFTRHTVPFEEILSGGPLRDQIPPLDNPNFETTAEAGQYLEAREPVVQLVVGDDARAYPLRVMIWHEIVNDEVGAQPISVTFCPLCNTSIAFDRRLDDMVLSFGTSGTLRNSDLVMWDRQTESWWQQFGGEGIIGELAGRKLTQVPASIVAWEDFVAGHPDGQVLSQDTGFDRAYGQNPYTGYDTVDQPPFFPADNLDDNRLPPKARVVFLERGGDAVAIPFSALAEAGTIEFSAGGETFVAEWLAGARSALGDASIADADEVGSATVTVAATGETATFDTPFWFAVAAFRPDAAVISG